MSCPACRKGPFAGITMDRVDRFPSTAKFSDIAGIDQVATTALHCFCATYERLLAAALLLAPKRSGPLNAGQAPACCYVKPWLLCKLTMTFCSFRIRYVPGRQQLGTSLVHLKSGFGCNQSYHYCAGQV